MLRKRLLILVLLVLLPALAPVWRGSSVQQKMEIRAVRQNVLTTTRLAASSQEYFLRHSQRLLATVSKFQFLTLATNWPFCEWHLGILLLQPDYADFGLIENDGSLFCTALKTNYPQSMEAHFAITAVAPTDQPSVGAFENGPISNEPIPRVDVL